jgi:tryptophan-rich sensory protein
VPLTPLIFTLSRSERLSAKLQVPYYLWVFYNLAWIFEPWRLNGCA